MSRIDVESVVQVYANWSKGGALPLSDVYVILRFHEDGLEYLDCMWCQLHPTCDHTSFLVTPRGLAEAKTKMIEHLCAHHDAGDLVPLYCMSHLIGWLPADLAELVAPAVLQRYIPADQVEVL